MKNRILTILLAILVVLSTTNIVFAEVEYPFTVTYHFKYKTSATEYAEKTWSQQVRDNSTTASKVINKIVPDTTPKKYTENGREYIFAKRWVGPDTPKEGVASTERVYIRNKDYEAETHIYYEAVYETVPIATVHAVYLNQQAEQVEDTTSNALSMSDTWTIKEGNLDDNISKYKRFEYNGLIYTFTGWDQELPFTISNITKDTDYYFVAQYDVEKIKKLTVNYIDNVARGDGLWSNDNTFVEYKHTFKKPADIPEHYTFLYWENGDDKYYAGDTFTKAYADIGENEEINFTAVYEYQPPLNVHYHYGENKISTITADENISLYDKAPEPLKWFYEGEETPINEDEIITIPNSYIVREPVKDEKNVHVHAKYFTINWLDDNGDTLSTNKMVPYGELPKYDGETPFKDASAQYTYKFIGWDSDITPATENKDYTAVYNSITNIYTVKFVDYDDTQLSQDDYEYGTAAKDVKAPIPYRQPTIKYTYIFSGWTPEIEDVTKDATYKATWKEKEIIPDKPDDPEEKDDTKTKVIIKKYYDEKVITKRVIMKPTVINRTVRPTTIINRYVTKNYITENNKKVDKLEEEVEELEDGMPPLAARRGMKRQWALFNLLFTLLITIMAAFVIVKYNRKKDQDQRDYQTKHIHRILSFVMALLSIVIFFLTTNFSYPMGWFDQWTILFFIFFVDQLVLTILNYRMFKARQES